MTNRIFLFRDWEYWSFKWIYTPVLLYGIYLAIKARALNFFTAANPSIPNGGLYGDSKFEILKKIPSNFIPKSILISDKKDFNQFLASPNIHYPFIAKPDIGERGIGVKKISLPRELNDYYHTLRRPFIIQEYIPYELELGVFFYRFPDWQTGKITSIVKKEFLSVTGDGSSSIMQLMMKTKRATLQIERLKNNGFNLSEIIEKGRTIILEPIGNHNRGTAFLNANSLINKQLESIFSELSNKIEGFYYGRFDIRCSSLEDLYLGKNIKIMELNGTKAEPAHIYQPGYSLLKAYKEIFEHWRIIYEISQANRKLGFKTPPLMHSIKNLIKYNQVN